MNIFENSEINYGRDIEVTQYHLKDDKKILVASISDRNHA